MTMEKRESELNNITQQYEQGDSLKWLNSGGVPKLKIYNDEPEYTDSVKNNVEMVLNEKNKKPVKKVKFKSSLKQKILKNSPESNVTVINTDSMREKQMNEFFKQKNESLNGNKTKEGDMYLSKRDIINEIEKREKGENETKKENSYCVAEYWELVPV